MEAEGWFRDPYGQHDDRWFSAGHPTSLVRDGAVESRDEPPLFPINKPLLEAAPKRDASQSLRNDETDGEPEPYGADTSVGAVMEYLRLHPGAYPF